MRTFARRSTGTDAQAGFGLAEVMVSLAIIVTVAVVSAPIFENALARTANLGTRQTAVTVASQQLEYVRSLKAASLVRNRPKTLVDKLNGSPGLVNLSQDITNPISGDLLNYDPNAAPSDGSAAAVPISQTRTLNRVDFTIATFVNACNLAVTGSACTRLATANSHEVYRVSVDVSWRHSANDGCSASTVGTCEYVVTTLRDPSSDPTFTRLTPPVFGSMVETYGASTVNPIVVHPRQHVTLVITGSGFQYNVQAQSNDSADVTKLTTATTSTLTVDFTASSNTTTHSLVIINPDGGSVTVPVPVAQSGPTISGVTPAAGRIAQQNNLVVSGSDFYTDASGVLPTVTLSGQLVSTSAGTSGQVIAPSFTTTDAAGVMASSASFAAQFAASAFPTLAGYPSYKFLGTVTLANPDGGSTSYPNYTLSLS